MNAIPAQVAGVPDIVMVVPTPGGVRNPLVLAAAHVAGASRAYAIGGAQAIAALAYGTGTIAAVDKICGPGNAYVAAAKRRPVTVLSVVVLLESVSFAFNAIAFVLFVIFALVASKLL
jgi:histidinol dehydrogenase